jgi:hypothetical protein
VADRIEALGVTDRASLFAGRVLHHADDEVLQRLVGQAAAQLGTPMAIVSLILDHVQLFRAQVGLPGDLQRARGTDRDQSFCQLVVADEAPLVVTNAPDDERVPQALVERYGIGAYLGIPIRVRGSVAGSLCVIDTKPRAFSSDDHERLQTLADAVSSRLDELASAYDRAALLEGAALPAFGELRNLLMPLALDVRTARVSTAEIGTLLRWLDEHPPEADAHLPAVTTRAAGAYDTLVEAIEELEGTVPRVRQLIEAMEQMVRVGDLNVALADVITHARHLATHQLRLVGPLEWPEPLPAINVIGPRPAAIASTSAVLSLWATAQMATPDRSPRTVSIEAGSHDVRVTLPTAPGAAPPAQETLEALFRESALVTLDRQPDRWIVTYTRGVA